MWFWCALKFDNLCYVLWPFCLDTGWVQTSHKPLPSGSACLSLRLPLVHPRLSCLQTVFRPRQCSPLPSPCPPIWDSWHLKLPTFGERDNTLSPEGFQLDRTPERISCCLLLCSLNMLVSSSVSPCAISDDITDGGNSICYFREPEAPCASKRSL